MIEHLQNKSLDTKKKILKSAVLLSAVGAMVLVSITFIHALGEQKKRTEDTAELSEFDRSLEKMSFVFKNLKATFNALYKQSQNPALQTNESEEQNNGEMLYNTSTTNASLPFSQ